MKTTEQFINEAKKVHDNKYNYSKVNYIGSHTKVCIICLKHGEFWQTPNSHLNGKGCPKCGNLKKGQKAKKTKEEFIEKAKEIHGDKYDYSKVEYKNNHTKVCIICPEHGEFWMKPMYHLCNNSMCPECAKLNSAKKRSSTTEEFVEKAREVHGDKYDYSKVEYKNNSTKVCIICSKHGEFWMKPNAHLNGQGCPNCCKTKKLTTEEFVEKAREVHSDKYDYSKVEYKNNSTKVCIICSKHGEFWQTPHSHLNGYGCIKCSESKLEKNVREILFKNKIIFEEQKTFNWLKNQSYLRLDFYLPEYNTAIECQGLQHYKSVEAWGGDINLEKVQHRDNVKLNLCRKHNINILYILYNDTIYNIEEKINNILNNKKTCNQ